MTLPVMQQSSKLLMDADMQRIATEGLLVALRGKSAIEQGAKPENKFYLCSFSLVE